MPTPVCDDPLHAGPGSLADYLLRQAAHLVKTSVRTGLVDARTSTPAQRIHDHK
jgi:hypothetical protein